MPASPRQNTHPFRFALLACAIAEGFFYSGTAMATACVGPTVTSDCDEGLVWSSIRLERTVYRLA